MNKSNAYFDSETQSAYAIFKGILSTSEFQHIADSINDIRERHHSCKLLTDSTDMKVLTLDTQRWIFEEWLPKAKDNGLTHFAYVMPTDIFGQLSFQFSEENKKILREITIKPFKTVDDAKIWLKAIK
jgi:hypothetical protein